MLFHAARVDQRVVDPLDLAARVSHTELGLCVERIGSVPSAVTACRLPRQEREQEKRAHESRRSHDIVSVPSSLLEVMLEREDPGPTQVTAVSDRFWGLGACELAPTAPEVIIPDPGEQEACTFSIIKSAGMMSSGGYRSRTRATARTTRRRWGSTFKKGSLW